MRDATPTEMQEAMRKMAADAPRKPV